MTIAKLIKARVEDTSTAILYEDYSWSYREYVCACAQRAAYLLKYRGEGAFHVGLLMDNIPEVPMWMGACAVAGATVVGLNTTRRGSDLVRDIQHTECQFLVIEEKYRQELESLESEIPPERLLIVSSREYAQLLAPFSGVPIPKTVVTDRDTFMLIFTSGTSGAPKAVICSHGRIVTSGAMVAQSQSLTQEDVNYISMPLFHANSVIVGWVSALSAGCTVALRRKFSASGFLPDIRKYGATFFNYVGKPLAYILSTPEKANDDDNPLHRCYGNEAADRDIKTFARRFGCKVTDAYGSTEGAVSVIRTPDMPKGALGIAREGTLVVNSLNGNECPRAKFDEWGQLLNANVAIGELVNTQGTFEGYWKNEESQQERLKGGIFRSGDLAYRDEQGFFYFAGRDNDWMRVDGENIAAVQVEDVILRWPDVSIATVYGVPDPITGDRVMVTLQLRENVVFNCALFINFLHNQSDFSNKWTPVFVRVASELPLTASNKIMKCQLQQERWNTVDPVYWQKSAGSPYTLMTEDELVKFEQEFVCRDRGDVLKRNVGFKTEGNET